MDAEFDAALTVMKGVEGWFSEAEAALMYRRTKDVLLGPVTGDVLEVGSYCGRSTVILAAAAQKGRPSAYVFAVDPHEGEISRPGRTEKGPSTLDRFRATIRRAGQEGRIREVLKKSYETRWSTPIAALFIDGFHDLENVSRDWAHFSPWLPPRALAMFHDYKSPDFPDVAAFVDGLVSSGALADTEVAGHLMTARRP